MPDAMGGYRIKGDTSGRTSIPSEKRDDGTLWVRDTTPIGLPGDGDAKYRQPDGTFLYELDPRS